MADDTPNDVDLIADFLRKHPTIFEQRPDLLDHLKLRDSRGTSSLLERQVARLQDRIEHIYAKHNSLVDVANDNQNILNKLDNVFLKLLTYRHLSEFIAEFPRTLREVFTLDEVTLKTASSVAGKPSEKLSYKEAARRLSAKHSVCDDRWPLAVTALFFKAPMASTALVPLLQEPDGEILGIVALGSSDPKRFAPDLGSAHLDRIGLLAGTCLARLMLDAS